VACLEQQPTETTMNTNTTETSMIDTSAISAIYRRAAAIMENTTTQDLRWCYDVMAETDALLNEAMGDERMAHETFLPILDDVISSNPPIEGKLSAALARIEELEQKLAATE